MSTIAKVFSWIFSLGVAGLYIMTLFFKFTGAPESIYIFEKLAGPDLEAFLRIGTGIAELVTAILIIVPKTRIYGAIMSLGVIVGAIFSHLTILGISVNGDGGELFLLACIILILSAIVAFLHKNDLPFFGKSE